MENESTIEKNEADVPSLFRLNIEVGNLDEAADFTANCWALRDESKRDHAAISPAAR